MSVICLYDYQACIVQRHQYYRNYRVNLNINSYNQYQLQDLSFVYINTCRETSQAPAIKSSSEKLIKTVLFTYPVKIIELIT